MKQRVDFKAYDKRGALQLATWANGSASIQMEGEVYQRRLNRGDFLYVEVSSSDPHFRNFTMRPGRAEHLWNIGLRRAVMADTMSYIRPFIEAVYPEAPDLALASFSERQCLIDATERIRELDREAATLRRHLGFAVKLFDGLPFLRGTAQVEAMRAALKSPPTQGQK